MRYAIATWNYARQDVTVFQLIRELAGMGFDAMSFLPSQILQLDGPGGAFPAAGA